MIADLSSLEQKLDQLIQNYRVLQGENQDLRNRIAVLESNNRHQEEILAAARARLEGLLSRLPTETE